MTKYIAKLNGEIVGNRTTQNRTYTHAVVVQKFDTSGANCSEPFVATWCGSPELARKASTSSQYVRPDRGNGSYRLVAIVEAEEVVKPSNAKLAKALNDSGVFAPFTCIAKED